MFPRRPAGIWPGTRALMQVHPLVSPAVSRCKLRSATTLTHRLRSPPLPTPRHGRQNSDGRTRRAQQPHIPHRRREPAATAKREAHRAARCLQPASQARRVDENYRMECAADKILAKGRRDAQRHSCRATADGVCLLPLRWCSEAYVTCRVVSLRPTTHFCQTPLGRTRRLPSQKLLKLALPPSLLRYDGLGGPLLLQAHNHPHRAL